MIQKMSMLQRAGFLFVGCLALVAVAGMFALKPDQTLNVQKPSASVIDASSSQKNQQNIDSVNTTTVSSKPELAQNNTAQTPPATDKPIIESKANAGKNDTEIASQQNTPNMPMNAEQLAEVMQNIDSIYQQSASGEYIEPEIITTALDDLDIMVDSSGMALYEAVEIKGFLLELMENPPQDVVDKLAKQTAQVDELASTQATESPSDQSRSEAYEREKARLTERLTSTYPDSPEKVKAELEAEVFKLKKAFFGNS